MEEQYAYAVSACLCGKKCRFDGKSKPNEKVIALCKKEKCLLVCPECLGGLEIPRQPCEIKGDRVISKDGLDRTENYQKGALEVLRLCKKHGIKKAILKQNSPSCASRRVYDGTFSKTLRDGMGICAKLLSENGIEVCGEESL